MRKLVVASLVALGFSATLGTAQAQPAVPYPAKELTIVQPTGVNTLLSSYRGKVVMLACMFTTCPHCQALSQVMTKLQGELGPKGFQAVGAAFNDEVNSPDQKANLAVTGAFVRDYHVGFPVGRISRDTFMSFVGLSVMDQRWVVPQILIIDRKGQVVAQSDPKGEKTPNLQKEDYLRTYLSGLLESGGSASKGGSSKSGDTKKAPSKPVDKKTT